MDLNSTVIIVEVIENGFVVHCGNRSKYCMSFDDMLSQVRMFVTIIEDNKSKQLLKSLEEG